MILKTLVGLLGCFLKSGSFTAHIAIGNAPDHEINDGADRCKNNQVLEQAARTCDGEIDKPKIPNAIIKAETGCTRCFITVHLPKINQFVALHYDIRRFLLFVLCFGLHMKKLIEACDGDFHLIVRRLFRC